MKRHICSSPIYDPDKEEDQPLAERLAPYSGVAVDDPKVYKEEGIYPGLGSYHIYHRIDGKLVGLGVCDITKSILNSQYFIYNPEFNFLSMGVIGAIHELEYMKLI